jgi:AcrR family transcriptional regulator
MTRGRPRQFDPSSTLDQAQTIFERDGFEAASVQSLADAMGICKPSLYAAYGNKEALFIAVLQRYAALNDARRAVLLDAEPDGARAVERLLSDAVRSYTACTSAGGCLIVAESAGATSPGQSDAVREALAAAMNDGRSLLLSRLERAQLDGELACDADVESLATYFATVMAGLSVLARSRASAEVLHGVVTTAMRAWPARAESARRAG